MSLSKEEILKVDEIAGPITIKGYFFRIIWLFVFLLIPMSAVVWMEFFEGPKKIDNILVMFMIVSIIMSCVVQSILFLFYVCFIVMGDETIKREIEKRTKKDVAKSLAIFCKGFRNTVYRNFTFLLSVFLAGVFAYIDHIVLSTIFLSLILISRILLSFMRDMFENYMKKYFLSGENDEL